MNHSCRVAPTYTSVSPLWRLLGVTHRMTHRLVTPDEAAFTGLPPPAGAGKAGRTLRILGFACLASATARRACGWMEEAVRAGKCADVSEPIQGWFSQVSGEVTFNLKVTTLTHSAEL